MKPVTNRLLPVLQASMEIRTATKVNGWLYFIKKLPIVGKRIPDRVYRWQTLKTVLAYITLPARFIGLWFGKALYVLLMAALPAILAAGRKIYRPRIPTRCTLWCFSAWCPAPFSPARC